MAGVDFSVAELARALERASDDIKREVGALVVQAAHTHQRLVQQAYPVGPTGNLRGRVIVTSPRGYSTTGSGVPIPTKVVKATAPHVHIWQEGTKPRFDPTRGNARRGVSPRHGRIFERLAVETRTDMLRSAQDVLDRNREL